MSAMFWTPAGHYMVPRFVTKLSWQYSLCAGDMLLDMPYRLSLHMFRLDEDHWSGLG